MTSESTKRRAYKQGHTHDPNQQFGFGATDVDNPANHDIGHSHFAVTFVNYPLCKA
jgi:hypothetical protein